MASVRTKIRTRVGLPLDGDVSCEIVSFLGLSDNKDHVALCFGDTSGGPPLVRIHSECLTGDVFGSMRCDCGHQLKEGVRMLNESGGILLYLRQEGRGIGLYNKLESYVLQDSGFDTYEANRALGYEDDCRNYQGAAQMLLALGANQVRLLSNNPDKGEQLVKYGVNVTEQISTGVYLSDRNKSYLLAKKREKAHRLILDRSNSESSR